MHISTILPLLLLLISFLNFPVADARCCHSDAGGDCGDNSSGTPCCGYKKCNGFCCACEGVGIIRQEVEQTAEGGKKFYTTSIIIAPVGVTWTCRQDHITKDPPKIRMAAHATPSDSGTRTATLPIVTAAPHIRERPPRWSSECDDTLKWVSHGSGRVTPEQYRKYFNVTDEQSDRYKAVDAIFHARDADNNGVLTQGELAELLSFDDINSFT